MAAENGSGSSSRAALEAEAAISRARLADDIQALSHKLAPQNLKSEARQAIVKSVERRVFDAEARVSRFGAALQRSVARHPVPVAVAVLLGIGALIWRARRA
jgi:hypothetical protein